MSLSKWFVLTVCLLPLVGCGGSDSKATPAARTTAEIEPLALPDEVSDELRKSYTHASRGMSPDAIHKFAMITEDVGLALTPNEIRYEFFKQSARLLREALADGADIDDEDIALITYNEACAFSKENKTEEAMRALGEAMKHGYRNIQHINSDEDLVNIRKLDNFSSELAKWQVVAEGHHAAEIAKLLESGETFPFEFTLTDTVESNTRWTKPKGKSSLLISGEHGVRHAWPKSRRSSSCRKSMAATSFRCTASASNRETAKPPTSNLSRSSPGEHGSTTHASWVTAS